MYYEVREGAPARFVRAARVMNAAAATDFLGGRFGARHEVPGVRREERLVWFGLMIQVAVISLVLWPEAWTWAIGLRDAIVSPLLIIGGCTLLTALVSWLFFLVRRETLVELIASHLFGTPARPELYIDRGVAGGWITPVTA